MKQDDPDFVRHLKTSAFLWGQVCFLYMTFRSVLSALFGLFTPQSEGQGAEVVAFILMAFIFWMMGREVNKHSNKRLNKLDSKE